MKKKLCKISFCTIFVTTLGLRFDLHRITEKFTSGRNVNTCCEMSVLSCRSVESHKYVVKAKTGDFMIETEDAVKKAG